MAYAFIHVFSSYFCKTHKGKWKRVHANMTIVHFNHAVALLAFEKKRGKRWSDAAIWCPFTTLKTLNYICNSWLNSVEMQSSKYN